MNVKADVTFAAAVANMDRILGCIDGIQFLERKMEDYGTSYFVSFSIPNKGYWVVWTNVDIVFRNGLCCMNGYQLSTPIDFDSVQSCDKKYQPPFFSAYNRICKESGNLIHEYPHTFYGTDLYVYIKRARDVFLV